MQTCENNKGRQHFFVAKLTLPVQNYRRWVFLCLVGWFLFVCLCACGVRTCGVCLGGGGGGGGGGVLVRACGYVCVLCSFFKNIF